MAMAMAAHALVSSLAQGLPKAGQWQLGLRRSAEQAREAGLVLCSAKATDAVRECPQDTLPACARAHTHHCQLSSPRSRLPFDPAIHWTHAATHAVQCRATASFTI
ncbi:hypothetical protein GUJ93_ZPchr0013g35930 [Zizania palustris]|uniref:Uncharacterized protein n=1 Tax=Zizania palustris TaxID=103762 RepID=A0A8J6C069_ZIZPA|nr:hypothetical protein GUJ93_ZPchr0013g35930 [Zizania palustris]